MLAVQDHLSDQRENTSKAPSIQSPSTKVSILVACSLYNNQLANTVRCMSVINKKVCSITLTFG